MLVAALILFAQGNVVRKNPSSFTIKLVALNDIRSKIGYDPEGAPIPHWKPPAEDPFFPEDPPSFDPKKRLINIYIEISGLLLHYGDEDPTYTPSATGGEVVHGVFRPKPSDDPFTLSDGRRDGYLLVESVVFPKNALTTDLILQEASGPWIPVASYSYRTQRGALQANPKYRIERPKEPGRPNGSLRLFHVALVVPPKVRGPGTPYEIFAVDGEGKRLSPASSYLDAGVNMTCTFRSRASKLDRLEVCVRKYSEIAFRNIVLPPAW